MANIIKKTGHEGEIHGCMQILSIHKKDKYYTRVNLGYKVKIASMTYEDIVNNIIPEKFQGKLVGNPYWHLDNNTTILFDINGKEIIIDTNDFDKVHGITWRAHEDKRRNKFTWYAYGGKWIKEENRWIQYSLHRYILDIFDDNIQIDHINLDGLDNRRCNIREATHQENVRHRALFSNNESGLIGIRQDKRTGYWQARITVNNKQIYLGESKDIEKAKRLRLDAEKKYFGEFGSARN